MKIDCFSITDFNLWFQRGYSFFLSLSIPYVHSFLSILVIVVENVCKRVQYSDRTRALSGVP